MRSRLAVATEVWLDAAVHDFRLATRTLRRSPGFTFAAMSSLAAGVALTAATLAVANAYLIRSLPYPAGDRLYHVMYAPPGPVEPRGITALDWALLGDVVEAAVTSTGETFYLVGGDYSQTARGLRVSAGFIEALGLRPALGRAFAEREFGVGSEPVAMIGHAVWRDRFGSDPDIVGRELRVNTENQAGPAELLRIVGVLPPWFWFGRDSRETVDLLVPLRSPARTYMVRLREGIPVTVAEQRITDAVRSIATSLPPNWPGVGLKSVHERYVAGLRPVLLAITFAAVLVLVIVCANISVLVLLRALRRQHEVGVRVALGARLGHLLRILVAEALLLCVPAVAIGLALAGVTLRAVAPLIEAQLGRPAPAGTDTITLAPTVFVAVGAAGLFIALSLSCIPLLTPWRRRLGETLRRGGRAGTDGASARRVRSALIALEVAGSLALLVGCGLMIRSALNLLRTDLGFETEQVVRARFVLPGRTYPDATTLAGFYERLAERIAGRTSFPFALTGPWPPFIETPKQSIESDAGDAGVMTAGIMAVGAGYFATLGINVEEGRAFDAGDRFGSEPVAVISKTLARTLWPDGSAIGRRVRHHDDANRDSLPPPWRTVVGVAADVRQNYADRDVHDIYVPFLQTPSRFAPLYIRTDRDPSFWLATLRTAVAELDPYVTVAAVSSLDSENRQWVGTKFLTSLLTAFAGFAVLLALLGIYGVTAYAVQQREREIAIRVALGATSNAVIAMFLKEGGVVLACGIGAGLFAGGAVARMLENQIHGVRPFDAAALAATCALMAVTALLATWWPTRRATRAVRSVR